MTWLIVLLLIGYAVKGDRNNFFTGKQFNTLKKWIIGIFLVSIFSSFIPSLLIASFALSPVLLPIIIVAVIVSKNKKKKKEDTVQRGGQRQPEERYVGFLLWVWKRAEAYCQQHTSKRSLQTA